MIYYENHNGEIIEFEKWPVMIQDAESLFAYNWGYTSGTKIRALKTFTKGMAEKDITISIFADSKTEFCTILDRILETTEADINAEIPGKIHYYGYYMECYIVAGSMTEWEPDYDATDKKLKIVSKDGQWIKETLYHVTKDGIVTDTTQAVNGNEQSVEIQSKAYLYDYLYDYGMHSGNAYVTTIETSTFGMDFRLEVFGYTKNPCISIGANTYGAEYTVKDGETLVIDSREKSCILQDQAGKTINVFRYRTPHNIYEKIKDSGNVEISWNGDYSFDLTLYENRSEPRWISEPSEDEKRIAEAEQALTLLRKFRLQEVEELPQTGNANTIYIKKYSAQYKGYMYGDNAWSDVGSVHIDMMKKQEEKVLYGIAECAPKDILYGATGMCGMYKIIEEETE